MLSPVDLRLFRIPLVGHSFSLPYPTPEAKFAGGADIAVYVCVPNHGHIHWEAMYAPPAFDHLSHDESLGARASCPLLRECPAPAAGRMPTASGRDARATLLPVPAGSGRNARSLGPEGGNRESLLSKIIASPVRRHCRERL